MLKFIQKKFRFWNIMSNSLYDDSNDEEDAKAVFSLNLKENIDILKNILGQSDDIVIREFAFGNSMKKNGAVVFIEGLTNKTIINENIIMPLMYGSRFAGSEEIPDIDNIDSIRKCMVAAGDVERVSIVDKAVESCLSGYTILIVDGSREVLIVNSSGWKSRGVEEPKTEAVVRGPREGFSETLRTNTALLRRKIKNPNLALKTIVIGKNTKTNVCIAYLKGTANARLIEEIIRRLKRINTDSILESGYIEQFIEDAPFSIFPTIANSEKPDIVAAKILEGRAAIMVDGTPFVLTVPMVFIENFQSAEDYYSRPYLASLIRMLRFLSYLISILAPAIYVALTTFHQELIPTPLLLTMAAAHEGVPFPAVIEAGIMIVTFEILREAGVRLPRPVGQAISIVGALVIGESAVSAGIIGAPMVIVVAITAVSSFVIPAQTDSGVILRFILLILAGAMGGFGIGIGLLGVYVHLASLRSFGVPYLAPIAPLVVRDLKDTLIRAPIWGKFTKPRSINWQDPERLEFRLYPDIEDEGKK
ncbi:spore germination protein [Lutispora saccharofermentans]|uniref:Spore germination protein n=1 Tax=Lutispora saccharofermentans TaxID=3024236 RepID=A0ABT1NAK8_9FIRM|nr:spore germination protein [Lutispora saccharofermentans]MCQ1528297.1 spore germination protein [Lutispora saccharofermentans]